MPKIVEVTPELNAIAQLLKAKLGSHAKAVFHGRYKGHFAEVYVIYSDRQWDGHKDELNSLKIIYRLQKMATEPTAEELVICINEADPDDLIDEVGISKEDLLNAIGAR